MRFAMQMGGFVIVKQAVHHWVVWLYWISPMQVITIAQERFDVRPKKTHVYLSPHLVSDD